MRKNTLISLITGAIISLTLASGINFTEQDNITVANSVVQNVGMNPFENTVKIYNEIHETKNNEKGYIEEVNEAETYYIVIADLLNIRESNSLESTILGTYKNGEKVNVIDKQGDWYKTDMGFCHSNYLKLQEELKTEKFTVNATVLNIRKEATINSEVVGKYTYGEKVNVIGKQGDWYKTDKGFCHSNYLSTIENNIVLTRSSFPDNVNIEIYAPIDIDRCVKKKSNLSIPQIELLLSKTKIKGISYTIKEVEELYNINSFFIIAVARLESANGTSKIARDKNNLFGLGAYDSNPYKHALSFSSPSGSVYKFGEVIERIYFNEGRDTLKKINQKYATDQYWKNKVLRIIKDDYKIINETNYK